MATAVMIIKPLTASAETAAARLSIAAALACLTFLTATQVFKPELDPSWHPISEYALGKHGWVMTLAFLGWGLSAIGLFVALRTHVRTLGGRIGLAFLLVGAAGPILAAVFPMDPLATAHDAMTTSGTLHGLGAALGDGLPIAAALITWGLVRGNPAWSTARRSLVWATVLAWLGFAVVSVSMIVFLPQSGGQLGPDVPIGWPNRFMVVAYLAWVGVAARSAIRLRRAGGIYSR